MTEVVKEEIKPDAVPAAVTPAADDKPVADKTAAAADTSVGDAGDGEGDGPEDDDILAVSREDLAAIKADPTLRKLYRGLSQAASKKFEAIANDSRIIDEIRADPMAAARRIAETVGLKVVEEQEAKEKGQKAVEDAISAKLSALFGDEVAKDLRPIMEQLAQSVVATAIAPLQQRAEQLSDGILSASSESEINAFKARRKGEVTPDIEKRMVEISYEVAAGERSTPEKYLETLFRLATADQGTRKATAAVVDRMKKAAAETEPGRGPAPAKVTATSSLDFKGKSIDQMLDAAWEKAIAELPSA